MLSQEVQCYRALQQERCKTKGLTVFWFYVQMYNLKIPMPVRWPVAHCDSYLNEVIEDLPKKRLRQIGSTRDQQEYLHQAGLLAVDLPKSSVSVD